MGWLPRRGGLRGARPAGRLLMEHTGPGTGRAGTDGAEGQREMLASLVKNVVGFEVSRANVSVSSGAVIPSQLRQRWK